MGGGRSLGARALLALISAGWDPGLFSMLRVLGEAVLPDGATTTFWGPGVSQGHSDALRRIDGVVDAKQYTRPVEATVAAVKAGDDVELFIGDGLIGECAHGARFAKESGDLVFGQAGHTCVLSVK